MARSSYTNYCPTWYMQFNNNNVPEVLPIPQIILQDKNKSIVSPESRYDMHKFRNIMASIYHYRWPSGKSGSKCSMRHPRRALGTTCAVNIMMSRNQHGTTRANRWAPLTHGHHLGEDAVDLWHWRNVNGTSIGHH